MFRGQELLALSRLERVQLDHAGQVEEFLGDRPVFSQQGLLGGPGVERDPVVGQSLEDDLAASRFSAEGGQAALQTRLFFLEVGKVDLRTGRVAVEGVSQLGIWLSEPETLPRADVGRLERRFRGVWRRLVEGEGQSCLATNDVAEGNFFDFGG